MNNPHLIGLITDTHDNKESVEKAVTLFNERDLGLVLHGGDYIAPFNAKWMAGLRMPFMGVFGNNDGERFGLRTQFESLGPIHRAPFSFEHHGKRMLLLHEPDEVDALASSGKFDVILYGHTHKIDLRNGPPLVVNPGEAGGWVTGRCTVGILNLDSMCTEIVDL
jgi:hypothetical protein